MGKFDDLYLIREGLCVVMGRNKTRNTFFEKYYNFLRFIGSFFCIFAFEIIRVIKIIGNL